MLSAKLTFPLLHHLLHPLVVILLCLDVVRPGQNDLLGHLGVLQLALVELGQLVHGPLLRHVAGRNVLAGCRLPDARCRRHVERVLHLGLLDLCEENTPTSQGHFELVTLYEE